MREGLNKAMLIGNLGTEPELKYTENNTPVCTFSMATNESWRAKDGKRHTKTEWHNITVWGKPGEAVKNYLSKGSPVHVEGRIQTNKFEKDGQKHYRTGIVASKVLFLGQKTDEHSIDEGDNCSMDDDDIPF